MMKSQEPKDKKLRQLSDEELKQVTGGASIDCSLPESKDKFDGFVLEMREHTGGM